ncbi:MAG: ASKHA domain-containing protein [Planctomycetota bacterium]|nr:ASKHA domain-containing protein [Planctomycetota bacterium]
MAQNRIVQFLPDDKTVDVPGGTTILAAANKAGVFVNSLCGGDGVCGRCVVIVRRGRISGGSTSFFTHAEVQEGYVLACEARVEDDLVVETPPEHRVAAELEFAETEAPFLAGLRKLTRYRKITPLVRKTYLELPPPTLADNLADLERLAQGLAGAIGKTQFQMGLKVMRRLPDVARKHDWKVTATTAYRGPLTEIMDVEGGNTTRRNLCIAADVGTTTVVCQLVDLRDGQVLGQVGKYNSQIAYGADVIRRIMYASRSPADLHTLCETTVSDLNELIHELVARNHVGAADISLVTAAGNTTMMHLLLGLPPANIRKEPYIGAVNDMPALRAAEIGLQINPRGLLYCLPSVAGFVGSDTVAGIFTAAMARSHKVRMLIDVGTNGEIAVGNKDFMVCASASAGPAFEGAECSGGMRATKGAIDHISLQGPDAVVSHSTIGSAAPVGLCGTGYIDLVADLLRTGVIDKTGRLQKHVAPSRVREASGELEYLVFPARQTGNGKDITITQGDLNNILRAKGAIYAAQTILLRTLNMTVDDVDEVLVAGAFGNFLNVRNAVTIGLLPDVEPAKLRFVGNTALAGARLAALSHTFYEEIRALARRTTYIDLSTEPSFMDEFVSACFFPHTDLARFPRVTAEIAGHGAVR